ncbi:MAG: hypothetical protein MJ252_02345 [archaeon]|nr:hypothetical protein [archaeon]
MSIEKQKCFKCNGDGQIIPYGDKTIPKCICDGCQGHGYICFYFIKCPKCEGVGYLFPFDEDGFNPYDCPLCKAKGYINFNAKKCTECNGIDECSKCFKGFINEGPIKISSKDLRKNFKFNNKNTRKKVINNLKKIGSFNNNQSDQIKKALNTSEINQSKNNETQKEKIYLSVNVNESKINLNINKNAGQRSNSQTNKTNKKEEKEDIKIRSNSNESHFRNNQNFTHNNINQEINNISSMVNQMNLIPAPLRNSKRKDSKGNKKNIGKLKSSNWKNKNSLQKVNKKENSKDSFYSSSMIENNNCPNQSNSFSNIRDIRGYVMPPPNYIINSTMFPTPPQQIIQPTQPQIIPQPPPIIPPQNHIQLSLKHPQAR